LKTFDKKTVFECYIMFRKKGIYYTLNYYKKELECVPEKGQYMHTKPGFQKLVNFLELLEKNSDNDIHLEERVIGHGSVDNGEYWGTFIDYFMCDDFYTHTFNDMIKETSFGIAPYLDYENIKIKE